MQDWRQLFEAHKLLGILLSMLLRFVLVVAVETLLSDVLAEALLNGLVALHVELNGGKFLLPGRLIIDVYAADYVFYEALEQSVVGASDRSLLHLLF